MTDVDLKALARLGAHARLAELVAEMDAILEAFPDLGSAQARPGRAPKTVRGGGVRPGPLAKEPEVREAKVRSRTMTPAQRKEVSQRMTRYWAERRKARGK